jgi:tetratricopeptide (TPR) repeat protein
LGKGNLSQAILDYDNAIQIDPDYAIAYGNRAAAYFFKKEYDKAWEDVRKAESLGHKINPDLARGLKKVSKNEGF